MRRLAWYLLLAFSFAIPWEYSLDMGAPFGNIARIAGVLVVMVLIPAVLQAGRMRRPGPVHWLVLGLYLWFCCSYFWSIDPMATLERMRAYSQVMMVALFAWELTESSDDVLDLMRAYVAGSMVLGLLTLADFVSPAAAGQVRFVAEGQDPNDAARFLDLGFPLAALLFLMERRWWTKTLALAYFPLGLLGVLLSASRGGLVAAAVAIAGCGVLLLRFQPRIVWCGLLATPVLAGLFWRAIPRPTLARIASIAGQFSGGDLNQRLNIWAAGVRAFGHAALIGSGAGTFVAAARLAQGDTAHNTVLSIAVEGGLIGVTLALAVVVATARSVLRTQGAMRGALGTALLVWMIASLAATVEGNRSTWFLIGLIAVAERLATPTRAGDRLAFDLRGLQATRRSTAENKA